MAGQNVFLLSFKSALILLFGSSSVFQLHTKVQCSNLFCQGHFVHKIHFSLRKPVFRNTCNPQFQLADGNPDKQQCEQTRVHTSLSVSGLQTHLLCCSSQRHTEFTGSRRFVFCNQATWLLVCLLLKGIHSVQVYRSVGSRPLFWDFFSACSFHFQTFGKTSINHRTDDISFCS